MNKEQFGQWIKGYITAWNSNDMYDIEKLFSEEAAYYTLPFEAPWLGREAIIEGWLGIKDEPGNFRFEFEVLAVDGNLGIVRGNTEYYNPPKEYANIWLIRLDDQLVL